MLEKTQRRLFRVLFLLGCVLPTLAVAGFAAGRLSPGYQQALLAAASERLGLSVACERLETPRPGVYALHGVRVGDGAACDRVLLTRVGESWRFEADELRLTNPGEASNCLGRLIGLGLVSEGRITAVTLDDATRLTRVRVATSENALRIASEEGQAAEFVAGALRVDTAGRAAPLAWLPPTPITSDWADEATFTGVIEIDSDAGAAVGRYDLRGITLGGLTAESGSLTEANLRWQGERLERLTGHLDLRDGVLSLELTSGLSRWLTPYSDELYRSWGDMKQVDFTDAGCRVALDGSGIALTAEGPVAVNGQTPLLLAPSESVLPMSNLVSAWNASSPAEIPSTPAAVGMASRLPAPLAPLSE